MKVPQLLMTEKGLELEHSKGKGTSIYEVQKDIHFWKGCWYEISYLLAFFSAATRTVLDRSPELELRLNRKN